MTRTILSFLSAVAVLILLSAPLSAKKNKKPKQKEPEQVQEKTQPEDDAPKVNPKQLEPKFLLKKKKRKDVAGDFDDKMELLYYFPKVYNRSKIDVEDYKLTVHIIGQSVVERTIFSILEVAEYKFNVASRKTFEPEERVLPNKYDDENSYRTGFKYYTYIISVKDRSGKVILIKCGKTKFNKNLESIIKFGKKQPFDDKGRQLKFKINAY